MLEPRPYQYPALIESIDEAAENIHKLGEHLAVCRSGFKNSLRSVKRWYAVWDDKEQRWCIGFSKFIGYKSMTGPRYNRYLAGNPDHEALSGRKTEDVRGVLRINAFEVDRSDPRWHGLASATQELLERQGSIKLRKDATIRILNGFDKND